MNLRCKVCDEKAAGFHFGAFTCEGCKSFFGRCCNNMSVIGECRNNKECTINKKNRTSCKACRLQKCLQVGMSKSGSRYGRRSNWFKQYFQETENQIKSPLSNHDYEIENSTFDQIKLTDLTNASTSERPSPVAVPDTHIRKKISPFDLYATAKQPLFSSHLYLNYFPALGLNRLVSYKHSGLHGTFVNTENAATAAAFLVPSTLPFSKLLQATEHNNVDDYLEKIFVAKYDGHDNDDDEMYNDNNPLDLSSKRSSKDGKYTSKRNEMELSKRTSPLDLSVK